MQLKFRLASCTTVHFRFIIKREVLIFLSFRKKKERKRIFPANFKKIKRPSFHCQKLVNQKY